MVTSERAVVARTRRIIYGVALFSCLASVAIAFFIGYRGLDTDSAPVAAALAMPAALGLAVVVAILAWRVRQRKAFVAAAQTTAARFGWRVHERDLMQESSAAPELRDVMALLRDGQGPSQTAAVRGLITGRHRERPFAAFTAVHVQSRRPDMVQVVTTPAPATLPPVVINSRPGEPLWQGLPDRHLNAARGAWQISCPDERFVAEVVQPRLLRWLDTSPAQITAFLLADGHAVLIGLPVAESAHLVGWLDALDGMVDQLPR